MTNTSDANISLRPFHLAFPVDDLSAARTFYTDILGCHVGRSSDSWIDFDFHGHQIVAHLSPKEAVYQNDFSDVDGKKVPVRHFGIVLDRMEWQSLADKLGALNTDFLIAPYIRFKGEAGEQGTFFITDPAGNGIEFKFFENIEQLFAT